MIAEHLNNTVWATLKPSPIHGIGVFAIRDIPKGTLITDYCVWDKKPPVFEVSREDFLKILPEVRGLILDRMIFREGHPIVFPSPNNDQHLRSFMNHSDNPNSDGERALVDIQKGEEITEDFSSFYALHELSKTHYSWLQ